LVDNKQGYHFQSTFDNQKWKLRLMIGRELFE